MHDEAQDTVREWPTEGERICTLGLQLTPNDSCTGIFSHVTVIE